MTSIRTRTATRPVAACSASSGASTALSRASTTNQVATEAANAAAAPSAIGRRPTVLAPLRAASTTASTRIASRPSRRTSTAESMTTLVRLSEPAAASVGSGGPPCVVAATQVRSRAPSRATPTGIPHEASLVECLSKN